MNKSVFQITPGRCDCIWPKFVGSGSRRFKKKECSGYFQIPLANLGFSEVIRRFIGYGGRPVFSTMIIAGVLVYSTNSRYPDLIIGSIVFWVEIRELLGF